MMRRPIVFDVAPCRLCIILHYGHNSPASSSEISKMVMKAFFRKTSTIFLFSSFGILFFSLQISHTGKNIFEEINTIEISSLNFSSLILYPKNDSTRNWIEEQLRSADNVTKLFEINSEKKFINWLLHDLELGWEMQPENWLRSLCPEVVNHFSIFPLAAKSNPSSVLFSPILSSQHAAQSVSFTRKCLFYFNSSFSFVGLYFESCPGFSFINKYQTLSSCWLTFRCNFTWSKHTLG